jgi:hypothetical protein
MARKKLQQRKEAAAFLKKAAQKTLIYAGPETVSAPIAHDPA